MESFLNRYRNITVLLLVIFAQLVLLAVQVKNEKDVSMIRVWTVTAVTPAARMLEAVRGGATGLVRNYILLHNTDEENRRLRAALDRYKIENIFLKNELNTAERAKALQVLQSHTPSKTLAATVIGTGAGTDSKVVFVDRGSVSGVQRGMAVVTPDGILGKVIASYPTASEVLLVTDPDFAAGVVSQKNQARGTLKGQGTPLCKVDYVPYEQTVDVGEWFYTSGDDRIFPRGFPVGVVKAVRNAQPYKEIFVEPSGLRRGLEDVLILVESVHQAIPDTPPVSQPVYISPPPPPAAAVAGEAPPANPANARPVGPDTEADKLRQEYKAAGDAQKHTFGEGTVHDARPVDFTKLGQTPAQGPGAAGQAPGTANPPAPQPNAARQPSEPATKTSVSAPVGSPPAPSPQPPAPESRRANQAAGAPGGSTGGPPRK